jgi:hypothetical protein
MRSAKAFCNRVMAKPFDSTLKQLFTVFAADWVRVLTPHLGLPPNLDVEPLEVEMSTVQRAADTVYRLGTSSLLHIESQVSRDGKLPWRLLEYNVMLSAHYSIESVYSVAVLLRPEANASNLTGTLVRCHDDGTEYHRFSYNVLRMWEQSMECVLAGGVGMWPLALLSNDACGHLDEIVPRMDAELRAHSLTESLRQTVLLSSYILLGLRYDDAEILPGFLRIQGMEESSTYQAIVRKGRLQGVQEGRQEGRQEGILEDRRMMLLDILRDRFVTVPPELEQRVQQMTDLQRLQTAIRQSYRITQLDQFQL